MCLYMCGSRSTYEIKLHVAVVQHWPLWLIAPQHAVSR